MLRHGAGLAAARKALGYGLIWGTITGLAHGYAYHYEDSHTDLSFLLEVGWEGVTIIFYFLLLVLPISVLFRRPAIYMFAMFWLLFRVVNATSLTLEYYHQDVGDCLYIFSSWTLFGVLKPVIVYYTLLRDSQYWLGVFIHSGFDKQRRKDQVRRSSQLGNTSENRTSRTPSGRLLPPSVANRSLYRDRQVSYDIMSPLIGQQIGVGSAREIARGIDALRDEVQIINFAFLSLGKDYTILGAGGTARVYKGKFKGQPVAIKLIYCMELTPDIVSNFYEEAIVMSRMKHENVVEFVGVSVAPPALCLVMELCEGNLYDFIHSEQAAPAAVGSRATPNNRDHNYVSTPVYDLDWETKFHLAIGCARGVAYLHKQNILHMDIKSLNFLVTRDLNVKICDFEWSREAALSGKEEETTNDTDGMAPPSMMPASPSTVSFQRGASDPSDVIVEGGAEKNGTITRSSSTGSVPANADIYSHGHISDYGSTGNSSGSNGSPSSPPSVRHRRRASRIPDTLNWIAPDVLRNREFTEQSDCYSLGIVLWEIFTGLIPLEEFRRGGQRSVRKALLERNYHPPIPASVPKGMARLLLDIWHEDPMRRPPAQLIVDRLRQEALLMEVQL